MRNHHPFAAWSFWLKVLASVAIAVAFGLWVHRQGIALVPSSDRLAVLWSTWWGVPGFLAFMVVVHVLRAYRWIYLLKPLTRNPPPMSTIIAVAFVGFMAIMVLPFRMGEFARPYLISARGNVGMSEAFGTIAIERVIDGLVLAGLLTGCLLLLPMDQPSQAWATYVGVMTLTIFVAALGVLVIMLWKGDAGISWLEHAGTRLWPAATRKVVSVLRAFVGGLAALPDRRYLVPFTLMTIAYWCVNAVGMWYLAVACGLSLSIVGGFAVMTILAVGILIPTGPGHFGNFQASVAAALTLESLPAGQLEGPGSVYIFALYVGVFGLTLLAGVISLMTAHITLARIVAPRAGD